VAHSAECGGGWCVISEGPAHGKVNHPDPQRPADQATNFNHID